MGANIQLYSLATIKLDIENRAELFEGVIVFVARESGRSIAMVMRAKIAQLTL